MAGVLLRRGKRDKGERFVKTQDTQGEDIHLTTVDEEIGVMCL